MQYSTYILILPYLLYKMSVEQAATLSFLELLPEMGSKAVVTHTLPFQGLLRDFISLFLSGDLRCWQNIRDLVI